MIDDLALIGHPMTDEEIISHTLNGLQDEFKELTNVVWVRDLTISFEDLYDKLLDEEMIKKWGDWSNQKKIRKLNNYYAKHTTMTSFDAIWYGFATTVVV